jgi:hypothetical protein
LPLEGWSNTETLGRKRFEHGAERGQKIGVSCLHEHAERSADSQSALLRNRSAGTFIDQQQVVSTVIQNSPLVVIQNSPPLGQPVSFFSSMNQGEAACGNVGISRSLGDFQAPVGIVL